MSRLVDLVVEGDPRILKLLAVCDLSTKSNLEINTSGDPINPNKSIDCNVPYKNVLASKIRDLLNEV